MNPTEGNVFVKIVHSILKTISTNISIPQSNIQTSGMTTVTRRTNCMHCAQSFPSRTRLFEHLRISKHAVYSDSTSTALIRTMLLETVDDTIIYLTDQIRKQEQADTSTMPFNFVAGCLDSGETPLMIATMK
eukprot:m.206628 g.206628  ORF g.206628 m.206628 type:complete len:132 (+) comp32959_c0_seq2:241-636(+)